MSENENLEIALNCLEKGLKRNNFLPVAALFFFMSTAYMGNHIFICFLYASR